jgi:protein-disulfide isomerase
VLETEPQIIEQYVRTGKVKLIYRHLNQISPTSEQLSAASECGADQGRFWELRRALYAAQGLAYNDLPSALDTAAAEAEVDAGALRSCVDAGTHMELVRADHAAATADGIRSRPVFRIGDQTIIGAQPLSVFQGILDQAIGAQ